MSASFITSLLLLPALLCSAAAAAAACEGSKVATCESPIAAAVATCEGSKVATCESPIAAAVATCEGSKVVRCESPIAAAVATCEGSKMVRCESPIAAAAAVIPLNKGGGSACGGTGVVAAAAPVVTASVARYDSSAASTSAGASAPSAVPLFPRAANPAAEFQAVLDLARGAATRHAVADIEDGNYAAALAKLDALAVGSFHWRGQVTNGYQQGFFLYALRGYCLETLGDVVKAYRSYQNSRACFDDETAAVQCSEPRLEVFLGLGRTCLVAGRYTDAFNWLDLVRLEASAMPRLAAAADRALIRRAIEIGDYHDAITNFWDLQCLLLETGNSKLAADAEATSNVQHSTLNVECAAAAPQSKFVRPERNLSREEHKDLAQLYFWTHQDRPGFKTLLDGITLLGIDNDLCVKDPMVEAYLNNIMRADDAEIQRFYDLLGYAITQARALSGDESYLADLVRARALLSTYYDHLQRQSDLEQVRATIAAARMRLGKEATLNLPRAERPRTSNMAAFPSMRRSNMTESVEVLDSTIEDVIMRGSLSRCQGQLERGSNFFSYALALCADHGTSGILYEGRPVCVVAHKVLQPGRQQMESTIDELPPYNTVMLARSCSIILALAASQQWHSAQAHFDQFSEKCPEPVVPVWDSAIAIYVRIGATRRAARVALDGLLRSSDASTLMRMLDKCRALFGWLSAQDMQLYLDGLRGLLVAGELRRTMLQSQIVPLRELLAIEAYLIEARRLFDAGDRRRALVLLQTWPELMHGAGFDEMRANAFAVMCHTNAACHHMLQVCETRRRIVGDAQINITAERRFLIPLLPNAAPLFRDKYALLVSNQSSPVAQAARADAKDPHQQPHGNTKYEHAQ